MIEKPKKRKMNMERGMTYVELIVVLSIFSIMSSIALFNYGNFQAKVNVKNLGSDIALHVATAQKSALAGALPPVPVMPGWLPSYGLYFRASDQKNFVYFADLDNNQLWEGIDCSGECLQKTSIATAETISGLHVFYGGSPTPTAVSDLTVSFTRPDSGAVFRSASGFSGAVSYVQITVSSARGPQAKILIFPSGRIEVN